MCASITHKESVNVGLVTSMWFSSNYNWKHVTSIMAGFFNFYSRYCRCQPYDRVKPNLVFYVQDIHLTWSWDYGLRENVGGSCTTPSYIAQLKTNDKWDHESSAKSRHLYRMLVLTIALQHLSQPVIFFLTFHRFQIWWWVSRVSRIMASSYNLPFHLIHFFTNSATDV